MVRTRSGPTEYKFVASKRCPNGELPSDPLTDRHRQTPKLCKKPLSQFIIAPRAQASRRCETQASLIGKAAKLWLAFRSLDLFRALREPDRRRRDEKRPCRSEQKTATNQNDYLTGKAPYKSCELQSVSRGAHRAKRRTNLRSTVYCKARLMALRMPLIAAQNSASTAGKSPTEVAILFMVIPPPGQIGVSPFRISIPRKRQGHHHRTCPVHVEPREEVRR